MRDSWEWCGGVDEGSLPLGAFSCLHKATCAARGSSVGNLQLLSQCSPIPTCSATKPDQCESVLPLDCISHPWFVQHPARRPCRTLRAVPGAIASYRADMSQHRIDASQEANSQDEHDRLYRKLNEIVSLLQPRGSISSTSRLPLLQQQDTARATSYDAGYPEKWISPMAARTQTDDEASKEGDGTQLKTKTSTSSQLGKPRRLLGLHPDAPIAEEHDTAPHQQLFWSRVRIVLREPFNEFWGTFILVAFGNASVAQVLLSTGQTSAPGGAGFGNYQSISWG